LGEPAHGWGADVPAAAGVRGPHEVARAADSGAGHLGNHRGDVRGRAVDPWLALVAVGVGVIPGGKLRYRHRAGLDIGAAGAAAMDGDRNVVGLREPG